jgi:hypothetical protein
MFEALARRARLEHLQVPRSVHALEFLASCSAGFYMQQVVVKTLRVKGIGDTRQSLRAFRMAIRDFVTVKYRVIEQRCCHVESLPGNLPLE